MEQTVLDCWLLCLSHQALSLVSSWMLSQVPTHFEFNTAQGVFLEECKDLFARNVKNLPVMQETQVQTLGGEEPLEKERATHSSILAWEIPWTEEPGELQSMGSQESDVT